MLLPFMDNILVSTCLRHKWSMDSLFRLEHIHIPCIVYHLLTFQVLVVEECTLIPMVVCMTVHQPLQAAEHTTLALQPSRRELEAVDMEELKAAAIMETVSARTEGIVEVGDVVEVVVVVGDVVDQREPGEEEGEVMGDVEDIITTIPVEEGDMMVAVTTKEGVVVVPLLWPQQDLRKMECHDSRMVHQ